MLRHNLLLIYRNFKRFKSTFFINLIGLSSGIACMLLIYLWVNDEWSFDRYHEQDSRLFQVMEHEKTEKGIETKSHTQDFLAEILAAELPEIERSVTVTPPFFFPEFTVTANGNHVKGVGKYASNDFFNVFSYSLVQGNDSLVLSDNNSIVISEGLANSLFRDISDLVGKNIEYQLFTIKKQVTITGVFKDVRPNSSEHFDFVLSFNAFRDIMGWDHKTLDWDNVAPFFTYVTVKEATSLDQLNKKIDDLLGRKSKNSQHRTLFLKPFSDNYLFGKYENGLQTGGRISYVKMFSLIAVFILFIACINFMNLSTAKASRRIKEIGIKKAMGAKRKTLIYQYLAESMLMSFLAFALAILIVDLFLPQFNIITGKDLALIFDADMIIASLCITLLTGLIAGSYPAFYLSGFNTAKVLKVQFSISMGALWARKGLVIFQFTSSVILIVAVLVVYRQIEFIQSKNLGYNRNNVVYFQADGSAGENVNAFLAEIKKLSGVTNASSMVGNLIGQSGDTPGGGTPGIHVWEGKQIVMNVSQVNYDMLETLDIKIIVGRSFSRDFNSATRQYIYNEAAIDAMGMNDPVGRMLPGGIEIVGVARNFVQSFHQNIQPHCFILEPDHAMTIMVKIKSGSEQATIEDLEKIYRTFNPYLAFDYKFLDETYQAKYASEQRVAILSGYFAGLTILISCLGLFGLAAFTAERRTKEIGIRKVLGSSVMSIVYLLSSDFTRIVLTAIIIGLPVSYLITKHWLDTFAFKIALEWWYFIGAGLIALFIAWLTVGTQAIKAASMNPTKCLRDE